MFLVSPSETMLAVDALADVFIEKGLIGDTQDDVCDDPARLCILKVCLLAMLKMLLCLK